LRENLKKGQAREKKETSRQKTREQTICFSQKRAKMEKKTKDDRHLARAVVPAPHLHLEVRLQLRVRVIVTKNRAITRTHTHTYIHTQHVQNNSHMVTQTHRQRHKDARKYRHMDSGISNTDTLTHRPTHTDTDTTQTHGQDTQHPADTHIQKTHLERPTHTHTERDTQQTVDTQTPDRETSQTQTQTRQRATQTHSNNSYTKTYTHTHTDTNKQRYLPYLLTACGTLGLVGLC
jgi:hypothetical protein